jgi:hypothetical protein
MTACPVSILAHADEPSIEETREIAIDAYTYAYPLILMDATRRFATCAPRADDEHGTGAPINQFSHLRHWPGVASNDDVRPNLDTLYSTLWFDVTDGPLIVNVPDSNERFYSFVLIDHWTDVFASVGARTTGTGAQCFAIASASWQGELPDGVRIYRSPTALGSIIGLTHVRGADDVPNVARFQAGVSATPWSVSSTIRSLPATSGRDAFLPSCSPADMVDAMCPVEYFGRFCELTRINPPHAHDYAIVDRMRRIGLIPGGSFDPATLSSDVLAAMDGARDVCLWGFSTAYGRSFKVTNGWRSPRKPRGAFGTDYATRAAVAFAGMGVTASEDAISYIAGKDAGGALLDSSHRYTLTFARRQQPPGRGFWSITLYDDRQRFAENRIARFALGAQDDLVPGRDGSITIYIQRESPGPEREQNWLPAPRSGTFSLALRLYWPGPMALNGSWSPPALVRIGDSQPASNRSAPM